MVLARDVIRFNAATKRSQMSHGREKSWCPPIPHRHVLVSAKRVPLAQVRLLGRQFKKADRRWSVRIDGVLWYSDQNCFRTFMWSPVRGFLSAAEAKRAIEDAREFIFVTEPDTP